MPIRISSVLEPLPKNVKHDNRESERLFRKSEEQNIDERKRYGSRLYWLIVSWLIGLIIIILIQGFDFTRFRLPTSVLLAFNTTTTAGVIGLLALVLKYLFSTSNKIKHSRKNVPNM